MSTVNVRFKYVCRMSAGSFRGFCEKISIVEGFLEVMIGGWKFGRWIEV